MQLPFPDARFARRSLLLVLSAAGVAVSLADEFSVTSPSPQDRATQTAAHPVLRWAVGTNNLVTNGGFEQPVGTIWTQPAAATRLWADELAGPAAFEGARVARPARTGGFMAAMFQDVTLPADADYATLFWADQLDRILGPRDPLAFLRVELRDTDDVPLRELFVVRPEPGLTPVWQVRSVDLTPWLGRTVRLAFEAGAGTAGRWRVTLDAVRVAVGSTQGLEFEVYFGSRSELGPADLLGRTALPAWPLDWLAPGSTNYWRVTARTANASVTGPTWQFTVGPRGSIHHLGFAPLPVPQLVAVPQPMTLTAEDALDHLVTNYTGDAELTAYADALRPANVLITEVGGDLRDGVEFMNLSASPANISDWKILLYDAASAGLPTMTVAVPAGTTVRPGELFVLREPGGPVGPGLEILTPRSINWRGPSGLSAAVLLLDTASNIVDFVAIGVRQASEILGPLAVPFAEWRGLSVLPGVSTATAWSAQRRGTADSQRAEDWAMDAPQLGAANVGSTAPFRAGFGRLPFGLEAAPKFTDGIASAILTFQASGTNALLRATTAGGIAGTSAPFDVQSKPYVFLDALSVREGQGMVSEALTVRLQLARAADTVVRLTASPVGEADVPATLTIPPGQKEARVGLLAIDDALLDGPQQVQLTGEADGLEVIPTQLLVLDNETADLALNFGSELLEGEAAEAVLTASRAPDRDIAVNLEARPASEVDVPPAVLLCKGERETRLTVRGREDRWLEGPQVGELFARVEHWSPANAAFTLKDNEPTNIVVSLPASTTEGAGVLADAGHVALGGLALTNLTLVLTSSAPTQLRVPPSVTILAGRTNATFDLVVEDDVEKDGAQQVTVTASAAGLEQGAAAIHVSDNDPASYEVAVVLSPQYVEAAVPVEIRPFDINKELILARPLLITARIALADGAVLGPVADVILGDGLGQATLTATAAGLAARVIADGLGARGESNPFNILKPATLESILPTHDIAWAPGTKRLFATVADGAPAHAGEIVTIDSFLGLVATWASVPGGIEAASPSSGLLTLSPDETTLFVTAGQGRRVQAWDVAAKTLLRSFDLEAGAVAADLAAAGGTPWRLAVAPQRGRSPERTVLLDSAFRATSALRFARSLIADQGRPETFFAFIPYRIEEWHTSDAGLASDRTIQDGPFTDEFLPMTLLDGRLFTAHGDVVDLPGGARAGSLAVASALARSPSKGLIASDSLRHQVLVSAPDGADRVRVSIFDAASFEPIREVPLALPSSAPRRMVLCDGNTLAVVSGGRLIQVKWPVAPPAVGVPNLRVEPISETPLPRMGERWAWTVTITNQGQRAAATDVLLRVPLPPLAGVGSTELPGGRAWVDKGVLHAHLLELAPGGSGALAFTIEPGAGGWTNLRFLLSANEDDADYADNSRVLTEFVVPSDAQETALPLNLPVREFVFDRARQQGYALERVSSAADTTTLFRLDPQTFVPGVMAALPGIATHLRLSADAQFLYVALRGGRFVRRIDLANGGRDLEFEILNPPAGYHYQLHDLEVDRADARSLIAVTTSSVGPDAPWYTTTATMFTDGQRKPEEATLAGADLVSSAELEMEQMGRTATVSRWAGDLVTRLRLTAEGLEIIDTYSRAGTAAGLLSVQERLYTAFGAEILAESGRLVRALPAQRSDFGRLAWESTLDRLVLLQGNFGGPGSVWPLQVFDRTTMGPVANLPVIPTAEVDSLALLEAGLLVFTTTDGKVWLVATRALRGGAAADLGVSLRMDPAQPVVGEKVHVEIVVTNRGPNPALMPAVTCELPAAFRRQAVEPAPAYAVGGGAFPYPLLWTSGAVDAGGQRMFRVSGTIEAAGRMSVAAGAADASDDPDRADNRVVLAVPVRYLLAPGQAATLDLPVLAAVYDSARDRILTTVTGDHELSGRLVSIDPGTGLPALMPEVGSHPSLLALADDGRSLYIATDQMKRVRRLNLETGQLEFEFRPVASPDIAAPNVGVRKLLVNPGAPDELALRQDNGSLAFYVRGQLRGPVYPWGSDIAFFAPDRLASPQYGFPFLLSRFRVTDQGLEPDGEGGPVQIERLWAAGGLVVSQDGRLVDPERFVERGQFAAFGAPAIDPLNRLVFFPGPAGSLALRIFDLDTQSLLGVENFGEAPGHPVQELFQAGRDRLVRQSEGELLVLRSSLVPQAPPADLAVGLAPIIPARVGAMCEWLATVMNAGPSEAPAARIDFRLPAGMKVIEVSVAVERLTVSEPLVSCELGALPPGGRAEVRLRAIAENAAVTAEIVASARSQASDPQPLNNVARLAAPVELANLENHLDVLPLAAAAVLYEPVSKLLYFATTDSGGGANAMIAMDPNNGRIVRQASLPGSPGRLAASAGGQFLYVSLDGSQRVARLRLPGLENDLVFATPDSTTALPAPDCDIVVLASDPRAIVLSRFGGGNPSPAGVWVLQDGQPKAVFVPGGYDGVTFLEPGFLPTELIALGTGTGEYVLRRLRLAAEGVSLDPAAIGPIAGVAWGMHTAGGLVLIDAGQLHDLGTLAQRALLPVPFTPQASAISLSGGRALFAVGSGAAIELAGFRTDTFESLGTFRFQHPPVKVHGLALWGEDRVAVIAEGRTIIGRLNLAAPPATDTDNDGLPDRWEETHGLKPLVADAADDPDADGGTNLQEFFAGTDPKSADSAPRIRLSVVSTGKLRLTFPCAAGRRWSLERAADLRAPLWSNLQETESTGGLQVADVDVGLSDAAFLRVRLGP